VCVVEASFRLFFWAKIQRLSRESLAFFFAQFLCAAKQLGQNPAREQESLARQSEKNYLSVGTQGNWHLLECFQIRSSKYIFFLSVRNNTQEIYISLEVCRNRQGNIYSLRV
jgi:hypothetical protein